MDLITQLKIFEGTKEYQKYIGYYRNGRFQVYKDHLGYPTIGYGHLIKKGESFPNGLTDEEAEALLIKDIAIAENDYRTLNLNLPSVSRWHDFMIMMLFQVGLTKTRGFKKLYRRYVMGVITTPLQNLKIVTGTDRHPIE